MSKTSRSFQQKLYTDVVGDVMGLWVQLNGVHSPRINGKLSLTANNFLYLRRQITYRDNRAGYYYWFPRSPKLPWEWYKGPLIAKLESAASAAAYGKFRKQLYEGNSQLGVTMAQYHKSRSQMLGYYRFLSSKHEVFWHRLLTKGWTPKEVANRWLEYIFGLVPVYTDIHAAATSVIQMAVPKVWVRGSHTAKSPTGPWYAGSGEGVYEYRVTHAASVSVANPNIWLAERAGLLNPARVAWDLVPWSFAVNMFVNINQLVQSITDFSGLTFSNYSLTKSQYFRGSVTYMGYGFPLRAGVNGLDLRRTTGTSPVLPRTLQFRLPEASWATVATAASLATQRFGKLLTLVNKSSK